MIPRLLVCLLISLPVTASDKFITLGATTSAYDTGLIPALRQAYRAETGVDLKTVIKGTGRVLDIGRRGDLDMLLVHDRTSEETFVAGGFAVAREELMYNDFIIVGPGSDPLGIKGEKVIPALEKLSTGGHVFVSRGDDSGTHKAERRLWVQAGFDAEEFSKSWYRSLGSGMGATLNAAGAMNAYTLTDRGTWLAFRNKLDLEILVQDDPPLRNVYALLVVSKGKFPHAKQELTEAFQTWLLSASTQKFIAGFRVQDQQLFFPLRLDMTE